jgi:Holliday junction resolvase RusA-like endonuclease
MKPIPIHAIRNERTRQQIEAQILATARREAEPARMYPEPGIVDPGASRAAKTGCERIYLPVTPCPKPRMTRRDQWMRRPAVLRYRAFCDAVRASWPDGVAFPESGAHVVFHVPMPRSWSRAKREAMAGEPHRQTPDSDNLLKALLDALHANDCAVWDVRVSKRWAATGYLEVFT